MATRRKKIFVQFAAVLACWAGSEMAQAQPSGAWSAVSAPTQADLHAVVETLASGKFVAVGSAGTILVSSTGASWTAESSGTTASLFGLTADATGVRWLAVGAGGVIVTSPDGVTWTSRPSGVTADLRAVAFSAYLKEFMAVGDGGVVIVSGDGVNWSPKASGTSADLTAVTAVASLDQAPGGFAVAGAAGTIVVTANGSAFTAVPTGTSLDFTAIGENGNGGGFYALGKSGLSGTVLFGLNGTPGWTSNSSGGDDYTGFDFGYFAGGENAFGLAVTAEGQVLSLPLNGSQLTLPGNPALNAVAADSPSVAVGDGGAIWVNAAIGPGAGFANQGISGAPVMAFIGQAVTLQSPAATGATYQWYLNGAPLAGATQSSLALANLQISQGGDYSVTVTTSGAIASFTTHLVVKSVAAFSPGLVDPAFQGVEGYAPSAPQLTPLPSGRILLGGTTILSADGSVAGTLAAGLSYPTSVLVQPDGKWVEFEAAGSSGSSSQAVRLNADGTLDPSFAIPAAVLNGAADLALLPNGKFVLFTASLGKLSWLRLNSDGSIDPSLGAGYSETYASGNTPATVLAAADAQGRMYVAVNYSRGAASSAIYRMAADQTPDPTFALPDNLLGGGVIEQIQPTSGGGLLYLDYGPLGLGTVPMRLGLLAGSGAPDGSYTTQTFSANAVFQLNANGSAMVLSPSQSDLSVLNYHFVRLTPSGQIDANVGGTVVGDPYLGSLAYETTAGGLTRLIALPGGQFLVAGNFSTLNLVHAAGLARLTPDLSFPVTRLVNLSVRGSVAPGQPLTIGGFVGGAGQKMFLFRGAGPALLPYGISNPVPDPAITLYSGQTPIASNDNWSSAASAGQIATLGANLGAFPFAAGSLDAALIASVPSGGVSLQVSGNNGGSGVALAEAYDADPAPANASIARVVNFSSLGLSGAGAQQATVGFSVAGTDVRRFLIRAVGPTLGSFGVKGAMSNPALSLYQGTNVVASNDDWSSAYNTVDVEAAAAQSGAFKLPDGSLDAALLVTLPPGTYTAIASGAGSASGQVLLEVYEVQD